MKYEPTNYIWNDQLTRTATTKTTASTIKRVRPMDAEDKRCKRGSKRQAEVSTTGNVANGFLKTTFLPKLPVTKTPQTCTKNQKTERDFYKSLSNLADHYNITPIQTKAYGYPYNVALAIWDLETKLKQTSANWDNFRLLQDSKKTYFETKERYNTGTSIYYIPILPLFQMLKDPKRKKTAQLLVSVCAYLYHIADIPYYRQEDSYLYWMYEMHKEWVEHDEESEIYLREFQVAEQIGDNIEQKLFNRINLEVLQQRLNRFKSRDNFDNECLRLTTDTLALYKQYPDLNIFRNATFPEEYDHDYEDEIIGMEKYISFIADGQGWLYDNLSDSINNEFNEYGNIQEPTICKRFDGSKIPNSDFDFENRLFTLIRHLCSILYNYKTTRI